MLLFHGDQHGHHFFYSAGDLFQILSWKPPFTWLMLNFSLPCRYEDALVLLLTEVLNRIQFRYNQAQLEELDDETLDDDVRGTPSLTFCRSHVVMWIRMGTCNPEPSAPETVLKPEYSSGLSCTFEIFNLLLVPFDLLTIKNVLQAFLCGLEM